MDEFDIQQQVLELEEFRINNLDEPTIEELEEDARLIYEHVL